MDLGSSLIGGIILLICIVPFVIMTYRRRRKENKKLEDLEAFAKTHNCEINEHEFCGDFLLGWDTTHNQLFFQKYAGETVFSQFIDLSLISACETGVKSRTVQLNAETRMVTEHVNLQFYPNVKHQKMMKLELYNDDINMQLLGELEFAEKWTERINARLKSA